MDNPSSNSEPHGADGHARERRAPPDADEVGSPRTSFCLLEATGEDRDSAESASSPVARPPPSRTRHVSYADRVLQHSHSAASVSSSTSSASLRSPQKSVQRGQTSSSTVTIPPLLEGRAVSADDTDSVAVADTEDLDSMRGLFRVDSSVFANPDNIAPSLQTSIIMGESQIVGQNGTLASLFPGKRRQRLATDALSIQDTIEELHHHHHHHHHRRHHHTGDTVDNSTAGEDSPVDPSMLTTSSEDFSSRGHSVFDANHRSWWRSMCCCWRRRRHHDSPRFSRVSMTPSEFAVSLWARVRTNWDSYLLFFTLALAIISIPVAVGAAALLSGSDDVAFRARCKFRSRDADLINAGISTAALTSIFIPMLNHAVLFCVSLFIAVRCSHSRTRVLKSSPTSMTATLTSAFMLPCFEFIWYSISFLNFAAVVLFWVSFYPTKAPSNSRLRVLLDPDAPYPCDVVTIPMVWMLQIIPFLMAQRSVSHEAVRRAIAYSGVACLLLLVLLLTLYKEGSVAMNTISICIHILLLICYCWAKFGANARSSFDFFFVIAVFDVVVAICVDIIALCDLGVGASSPLIIGRCVVLSVEAILTVAILLSLRADTRYWLGIDDANTSAVRHPFKQYMRHLSERGVITNFSTRTSVYDVHRMIEEHRKSVVDYSALKLECVIAQGATSIVMRGLLRGNKPIALKIYTAVHVTDEEVQRFSRETALNVQLSHPNIVKFYGLCVVPPSISLVFEFCEYGGLDGVLRNGSMHSLSTKLRAWLDACRAVAYLHSFSPPLLHRDIKTDNFLVGQDFTLKLADFGEANLLKPRSDGTMTIAGTVDYMAPEMILGGKTARYDTGVDVYSLMITLWQIMVPDRSPWEGRSHLEVYTCVTNGERPPLLPSIPSGCAEILEAGWVANPSERVAVEDIIPKVHQLWLLSTHQKTLKRTK